MAELIPTNALKLWNRILAQLMSRDRIDKMYPSPKRFAISSKLHAQARDKFADAIDIMESGAITYVVLRTP